MQTRVFTLTDEISALLKNYTSGNIPHSEAKTHFEKLRERVEKLSAENSDSNQLRRILRQHSSENFCIFSALAASGDTPEITAFSGASEMLEPVIGALAEKKFSGDDTCVTFIGTTKLYMKKYSKGAGKAFIFAAATSSDFFSQEVFDRYFEKAVSSADMPDSRLHDYYSAVRDIQSTCEEYLGRGKIFVEVFSFPDLVNVFSHCGIHRIFEITCELKKHISDEDPSCHVEALLPGLFVVIRSKREKLIETPHIHYQEIPLKCLRRVAEITDMKEFSDIIRFIISFEPGKKLLNP